MSGQDAALAAILPVNREKKVLKVRYPSSGQAAEERAGGRISSLHRPRRRSAHGADTCHVHADTCIQVRYIYTVLIRNRRMNNSDNNNNNNTGQLIDFQVLKSPGKGQKLKNG
ncbi:MAG: hypothetical protein LBR26_02845 [Prevotella sp.]|jgi:hypothetical protein|nr:hypothetical protein [Prevotella sp.]